MAASLEDRTRKLWAAQLFVKHGDRSSADNIAPHMAALVDLATNEPPGAMRTAALSDLRKLGVTLLPPGSDASLSDGPMMA